MLLRASLFLTLALATLGCGGSKKGGKLMVDTPVLPYKAPDIEELSGVSDDEPDAAEPPAEEPKAEAPAPAPAPVAASPAPTAQPAATKPPAATPTKAPAKPAAAPAAPAKKP